MADFIITETPKYLPVRKFEVTDAAHADLFNEVTQQLIDNNEFVRKEAEKACKDINNLELRFEEHCEDTDLHVSENEKSSWNQAYTQSVEYTDSQIGKLVGAAPGTMDTLEELANAIKNNETVAEALNVAIGTKAGQAELSYHTGNQSIHYTKDSIVNLLYPVGSIYQSSKATDPGILFGGTWQPIKDVVLVAAGNTFQEGTAGGSITHTLAVGNMPSHNHTFSGITVNSGGNSATPSATFSGTAVSSGTQSANHTHSIPALSGSAASDGAHTHTLGNVGGHHNLSTSPGVAQGHILWNGGTHKTSNAGAHTHTVKTSASTTGNNSASHTHSFTAKGSVALANTAHTHAVTAGGNIGLTGSGAAVNHMPPYKVMYVWERIS